LVFALYNYGDSIESIISIAAIAALIIDNRAGAGLLPLVEEVIEVAGLLLHLLVVHTANVVVAVVAAAGDQPCAASIAPVMGADHRGGHCTDLQFVVEEIALGALLPQGIQIGDSIKGPADEIPTAGGFIGFKFHFLADRADVFLRMSRALHLVGCHTAAALHIEVRLGTCFGHMISGLITLVIVAAVVFLPEFRVIRHQFTNVIYIHAVRVRSIETRLGALLEVLTRRADTLQGKAVRAVEVRVALGRIGHPLAIQSFAAIAAVLVAPG